MWQPRFPRLEVHFSSILTEQEKAELEKISGVRFDKKGKMTIPHHAIDFVLPKFDQMGLRVSHAEPCDWRTEPKSWEEHVETLKAKEEVHHWVLDGFCTDFQTDAIAKTGHWNGVHLWHPTGAGKTLSAILWSCLKDGVILVVTRAASRLQYGREFERFTNLRPHVIRPESNFTKKQRETMKTLDEYMEWCEDYPQRPVLIIGWEALSNNYERIAAINPSIVIFDESHRGKNPKRWEAVPLALPASGDPTEVARAMKAYKAEAKRKGGFIPDPDDPNAKRSYSGPDSGLVMLIPALNTTSCAAQLAQNARHVICTTATPIKDRVRDLWAQLDLAEPKSWGSQNNWMHRYCDAKPGIYGGLDTRGESNVQELASRLNNCIHRIDYRDTHRHLPPKRRQSVYVAPEDQCKPSAGFAAEMKAAAKRGATAVLEVQLAQAASKKRKAVIDLIEDHVSSGHKLVVFTGRRRDVDDLGEKLKKTEMVKKMNATVWHAHGGTDASDRQVIVDEYMSHSGPCVLVGTGESFGESLNLQDTDAALFVMLPYTPGQLRQWEGRFTRLGQKRPVVIYFVIAEDTVDEHVANILISKLPAVAEIAQDTELAEAQEVIAGLDDEEALLDSILDKL
jgi:SNF2 family DNA or RNA helicase